MLGRLVAAILAAIPLVVMAQSYPTKPVRVVVPYPAGSTPDIIGRTLAERLQKAFGQPFVVENRSGAGGSIGAEAVAKAAPDGHTLLIGGNGPVAINKHLYKSLSYDPDRDLAPISLLAVAPQMLVARAGAQGRGLPRLHRVRAPQPGTPFVRARSAAAALRI